jgi:hypothetical protein
VLRELEHYELQAIDAHLSPTRNNIALTACIAAPVERKSAPNDLLKLQ